MDKIKLNDSDRMIIQALQNPGLASIMRTCKNPVRAIAYTSLVSETAVRRSLKKLVRTGIVESYRVYDSDPTIRRPHRYELKNVDHLKQAKYD